MMNRKNKLYKTAVEMYGSYLAEVFLAYMNDKISWEEAIAKGADKWLLRCDFYYW